MNFREYRWFRNPRGLHNIGVFHPFRLERYTRPRMGWAKMVVGGNEYVSAASQLAANNCMTIIRIFRENMGAMRPPDVWYENYREYINNGCYWFELYNEPNLEGEWPQTGPGGGPNVFVSWDNTEEVIKPLMDNWIEWAERVIDLGGYPGFPALADSADHRHATVFWLDAFLRYLRENHNTRFRRVIANGLWCATHPYLHNHFYQEPPGGPPHVARPYYQERANEPGWHFEYPYDPLQQYHDPGRTVFGGTELTPFGDPNGLIASGQAFQELLKRYFDAGPVPVVGTEGGIWKIPKPDDEPHLIDDRYPPYSYESHAEATMAMWRWIVEKGPPWFWGVTLWNESDYYDIQGTVLAIDRMVAEEPLLKEVPDIDTGGGVAWEPGVDLPGEEPEPTPGAGPGPVRGEPDYHWLILAPGLQADWFFLAARRYWQTFRPTVLTDWRMIELLPSDKSLAVTVLARSDTIDYMNERVRDAYPNVFYDPIVFDSLAEMQAELDRRATYQQRFG
ncbi:MAG TPA: hypothetical protein ENI95_07780 [Chloroflexi bacterium]|nr:hypothetical protein [Chloroflexota bacterium]